MHDLFMHNMVIVHKSIASNNITFGNLPKSTAGLTLNGPSETETNPFFHAYCNEKGFFDIIKLFVMYAILN